MPPTLEVFSSELCIRNARCTIVTSPNLAPELARLGVRWRTALSVKHDYSPLSIQGLSFVVASFAWHGTLGS